VKRTLLLFAILLGLTMHSIGQENAKWSLGLGLSPFFDGINTAIYVNRHLGDRWQVGFMPFTRYTNFKSQNSNTNQFYFGANLNTRFYLLKEKRFLPYLYGFGGYVKTYTSVDDGSSISKESQNNFNYSLGAGTQFKIGEKGCSLDLNVGILWFNEFDLTSSLRAPFYSFGVFKRLQKSGK